MIYRQLLVSAEPIKKPHKLVCNKRSIMLDSIQPVRDIDSSILRACRSIYHEALPVLYGQNTFEFAKPRKLRDFSHAYLDKRNPRTFGPFKSRNAFIPVSESSHSCHQQDLHSAKLKPVALPLSGPLSYDSAMTANRTRFRDPSLVLLLFRIGNGYGRIGISTFSMITIRGTSMIGDGSRLWGMSSLLSTRSN